MKGIRCIANILTSIGGLNWGLIALFNFNLVEKIFGAGTMLTKIVYIVVGVCALCSLVCHKKTCGSHCATCNPATTA